MSLCYIIIISQYTHRWGCIAVHRQRHWCKFPPNSRNISERDIKHSCLLKSGCTVYLETRGCGCLTSSMLGWPVCGSTNAKVFTSNLLTWEWDVVFPCLSTGTELLMSSRGLGHLHRAERLSSAAWFASSACALLLPTRHTVASIQSV